MPTAWIDATAGVAGDMLLGALIDAGAPVAGIQDALDAVLPGALEVTTEEVTRGAVRACHARVLQVGDRSLERTWPTIRALLSDAPLAEPTRRRALAVFGQLARAEARVHGATPESVHFHEVGGLDAIGDVVGVCEALRLLGVEDLSASWVALGNGHIHAAHGLMPVPAPAVLELSRGWQVRALPGVVDPAALHHHHHGHEGGHGHIHEGGAAHSHDGGHTHEGGAAHTHDSGHTHEGGAAHSHDGGHSHEGGQVHPDGAHEHDHMHQHDHALVHPTADHDHTHPHAVEEAPATTGDPRDVGELATPTGMALIRALATESDSMPDMCPGRVGIGAGGRDMPGWANCVRVVLEDTSEHVRGTDPGAGSATSTSGLQDGEGHGGADHGSAELVGAGRGSDHLTGVDDEGMVELRANLDDIDHRLIPGVIQACLDAGAADAWVTPIQMKKGRPAVMVQVLVAHTHRPDVVDLLLTTTPTLGVRESPVTRTVLERDFVRLDLDGQPLTVKVGHRGGRIVHAQAEFASVAEIARRNDRSELDVSQQATAAIVAAGLTPGAPSSII